MCLGDYRYRHFVSFHCYFCMHIHCLSPYIQASFYMNTQRFNQQSSLWSKIELKLTNCKSNQKIVLVLIKCSKRPSRGLFIAHLSFLCELDSIFTSPKEFQNFDNPSHCMTKNYHKNYQNAQPSYLCVQTRILIRKYDSCELKLVQS